ncbi:MAG: asparaginase [Eubacteriales bacterium]
MTAPRPLHILVVFTGGTIASHNSGGTFEMSDAPYRLFSGVPSGGCKIEAFEPMQTLSENMTPDMLFDLFTAISDEFSRKVYDGMIIAHGTDTLAYTAQMADILLSGLGIPVVILGSKLPLDSAESDGQANFNNALALIKQEKSGVYVASRARDGTDYIHFACKVMQADSQTDDFQSYLGQYAGIMKDGIFVHNRNAPPYAPVHSSRELLTRLTSSEKKPAEETVLVLDACVGMNYQTLDLTRPEYNFIIQRLYHSGTSCTVTRTSPYSLLYLQDLCEANFKRLFIAPIEKTRTPYSTTRELLAAGITPVFDRPLEAVWAGLLVCTWLKEKPEEFFNFSG